jgi:hypothetical protein
MRIHQHFIKRILIGLVLVLTAISVIVPNWQNTAAENPITLGEVTTESNFRESFIFRAKAKSTAGKIVFAKILVHERGGTSNNVLRVKPFTPAEEVDLEYVWETKPDTTPPWQVYFYKWEVVDDAGNVYTSPEFEAEMTDNTRDWQKLSAGKISVYWYDQDKAFGETLLSYATRSYDSIVEKTGFTPEGDLRVILYNTNEDFCSYFSPKACLDCAGTTYSTITVQWITEIDYLLEEIIPHELVHAFLRYWLGADINEVPIWFDEGVAVNNQLDGADERIARARELASTGSLERLKWMEGRLTVGRDDTDLVNSWYDQATSLVAFLYDEYGPTILGAIISRIKDGMTFEEALLDATGLTLDAYELGWRKWLGLEAIPPTFAPTATFEMRPTPTYAPTRTPRK